MTEDIDFKELIHQILKIEAAYTDFSNPIIVAGCPNCGVGSIVIDPGGLGEQLQDAARFGGKLASLDFHIGFIMIIAARDSNPYLLDITGKTLQPDTLLMTFHHLAGHTPIHLSSVVIPAGGDKTGFGPKMIEAFQWGFEKQEADNRNRKLAMLN